jgi:hypothetical protein
MILTTERPQPQVSSNRIQALEAVLIMESRSRQHPGQNACVTWTQMYQAGHLHVNLNFQGTLTGGTLHGQVISLNRLKLQNTQITALNVIGNAQLETEFGQLEANASINANGDFEIVLEHPALYPLTLRLRSQHGLDLSVSNLELY